MFIYWVLFVVLMCVCKVWLSSLSQTLTELQELQELVDKVVKPGGTQREDWRGVYENVQPSVSSESRKTRWNTSRSKHIWNQVKGLTETAKRHASWSRSHWNKDGRLCREKQEETFIPRATKEAEPGSVYRWAFNFRWMKDGETMRRRRKEGKEVKVAVGWRWERREEHIYPSFS